MGQQVQPTFNFNPVFTDDSYKLLRTAAAACGRPSEKVLVTPRVDNGLLVTHYYFPRS